MLTAFQFGDQGLGNACLMGERPLRESLLPAALGKAIWIERTHLRSFLRVDRPHLHASALHRTLRFDAPHPISKPASIANCIPRSMNEWTIDEGVAGDGCRAAYGSHESNRSVGRVPYTC